MSYDIYAMKDGKAVELGTPLDVRGGTYAVGGTGEAWLNVTYNYGAFFYEVFDGDKGIRTIYGMTMAESLPLLRAAAEKLQGEPSDDYWEATPGNARAALENLIRIGEACPPDAVWEGD